MHNERLVAEGEVLAKLRLTARVAELEAKLGKNSTNSSKPPSTAHPHGKPPRSQTKPRRQRGGQPGHPKHERALIPSAQCADVLPGVPTECRRCGRLLKGTDPEPIRPQVWELPDIQPIVREYQQHRLLCPCGGSPCGELPEGVPTGQAGPRLIAFAALLLACFRQSQRRAAPFLSIILNQPASAGWMVLLQNRARRSGAARLRRTGPATPPQPVLLVDESPTREGPNQSGVWTFVANAFTFFACRTRRAAEVPRQLLGGDFAGVIHCDRQQRHVFAWLVDAVHAHLHGQPAASLLPAV